METKNLIIRESTFNDCSYFADWESNPAVTEFFSIDESRDYEEVVTEFIENSNDDTKRQFTILLKPSDIPIGRIYLSRLDSHSDSVDVTRIYIADPKLRNQGLGREALLSILEYAFISLHMERVTIDHFVKNDVAAHLYDKLGFKSEGILRSATKKNGKYYDLHLKSMIRAEYIDLDRTLV